MAKIVSSRRGSILVEAAVVMPVLAVLLVGTAEFGEAFMIKRRINQFASTSADLVAQQSCVTTANLQDVASIGSTLLQPFAYSSAIAGVQISSVIQNAGGASVQWSYGSGSLAGLTANSAFSLPSGLISQTQTIIVARTSYVFTPTLGSFLGTSITFTAAAYNYPRVVSAVPLKTSC